jgi:hypothetical protein
MRRFALRLDEIQVKVEICCVYDLNFSSQCRAHLFLV